MASKKKLAPASPAKTPTKSKAKSKPKTPDSPTNIPTQIIPLKTASAAYDITIGPDLLTTLHPTLVALMDGKPFRPFLITSPKIWKLWSKQVRASFPEAASPTVLFHPAGEKHKRFSAVESLAEELAAHGADRDALLIAFGGGVIGDITGFLAAIYMRGIPYIQIPTTLLAQVDSSVGGKTGVNLAAGKNLVGSFNHPQAVLADTHVLATLHHKELHAGLQESIKAGIIYDVDLFAYIEQNIALARSGDSTTIASIVAASVKVKAAVVAQDERESGLRMILNFGHTIGHAIEAATNYKKLLHGQAIGWGMIAALHLALARKSITPEDFARMANLILACGPLPRFKAHAKDLVALTSTDKKTRSGRRAFILPTSIGSAHIVYDVSDLELTAATEQMLATMRATGKKPS